MAKSRLYPAAKKRFGQNFLHDDQIIADIVAAVDPKETDHLVEIGPGRGAITLPLLQSNAKLDVIELDHDLVPLLQQKLIEYKQLSIHQADALSFDYSTLVKNDEKLRFYGEATYQKRGVKNCWVGLKTFDLKSMDLQLFPEVKCLNLTQKLANLPCLFFSVKPPRFSVK